MSLLTTTEKLDADNAADAQRILGFILAACDGLNAMAARTLAMPTGELTAWLQAKNRTAQFSDHYAVGTALHAAIAPIQRQLGQPVTEPCDLRSVDAKLAAQNRAIVNGAVVDLPTPEPQPEPAQDPAE
jgi:hypothetical protein